MKVIMLGTGSGKTTLGKSHSAIYVEQGVKQILFDCGEGTAKQLLKHGLTGDNLDEIVISHFHPDHVSGIYMLIQLLYLEGREKKLSIYLPENESRFEESLRMFYLFTERFSFAIELRKMSELDESVVPISNSHLRGYKAIINERGYHDNEMKSYSFLVREKETTLIYTSDLLSIKPIESYLDASNAIIIDALHPPAEELINLIDHCPNKLILTHGISKGLANKLRATAKDNIIIAEDDYEFIV